MFLFKCIKHWSRWPTGCSIIRPKIVEGRELQKLPLHVGIVIVEAHISYKDIANIIIWCITMGIWHISLYDQFGKILALGPLFQLN